MNECFTDKFQDILVKLYGEEVAGKKVKRGRDEVEVCDSVTRNVQFNVNCQMISWKGYLIK